MLHVSMIRISRYLDGDLDPKAVERVERHLARCATCRKRVEVLRLAGGAVLRPSRERLDAVARVAMSRIGPRKWNVGASQAQSDSTSEKIDAPIGTRATPARRWALVLAAAALWGIGVLTAVYVMHHHLHAPYGEPPGRIESAESAKKESSSYRTGAMSPSGAIRDAVGIGLPEAAKTFSLPKRDGHIPDDAGGYDVYGASPISSWRNRARGSNPPEEETWDPNLELEECLENTRWQWDGGSSVTIRFLENGTLEHPVWAREGFTGLWCVVDRRTALLYAQRGERCDIRAILAFSEDMTSFQGYGVRGTAQIRDSRPIEAPRSPQTPPK
ncbi:zf-HC2 domain-containing protein [Candidatus Sumerlaeota bacterium]|nr:zf-HC2 domain-containing protein [Candidatus Sumerlaeota bacterium]